MLTNEPYCKVLLHYLIIYIILFKIYFLLNILSRVCVFNIFYKHLLILFTLCVYVCFDDDSATVLFMCVQVQGHQKKKMKQMVRKELRKTSALSEAQERHIRDVWSLSQIDKWKLYR